MDREKTVTQCKPRGKPFRPGSIRLYLVGRYPIRSAGGDFHGPGLNVTVAHRETRAAPQAGAIPPWPSPPIARNLLESLSLFLAGKLAYPELSRVRSLGLILTSLLFDTAAFQCAGFRI